MTNPNQCESFRLAAMALADGESPTLADESFTPEKVREHLNGCSACRDAVAQLASVDSQFAGLQRQQHDVDVASSMVDQIEDTDANDSTRVDEAVAKARTDVQPTRARWSSKMVVALAVLIGMATWFVQSNATAAPSLAEVISTAQNAKSLKLKVTRDGRTHEVLVRGKDALRWRDSEDRYQIAKGDKLWRIDQRTQRFNIGTSAYFNKNGVDLFWLLGATVPNPDTAFKECEATEDASSDSFIYTVPAQRGSQNVNIEVLIHRANGRLKALRMVSIEEDEATSPLVINELVVQSFDAPFSESEFVVAENLTEDFRIGKIVDSEGIVTIKPVLNERWTPVSREMELKQGDWIRTDPRGPNAVAVRVQNAKLTLGPGALVELVDQRQARVHRGEVQVEADKKKTFELIAGKADALQVKGKQLLRLAGDAFKVLSHTPQWLAGFEGTQSDESLGSLIAKVDGRSVSLTVGYHKVTVEIRDQIARTTIEESFVNHTPSRLEGQFYFPLPQDASISGFGMWIGNELVEADVVEKQRAREIFETILREKRDPGLLEWTGGNIFKARVFPIFPHSEKRIKITYTQVLPLRGSKYRYTYGLRSELLKQTPLRELSIDLKVYSESKLRLIDCPSHPARIDQTEHAGHIEFSAEEYSPDADFEAVIEVDDRTDDVVVIPHQRGDDGYFMLQLTPPGVDGNWQRDLLPDGANLKLLVLADTSASMDNEHRKTQDEFIASLLMSLGPNDRFNLAACDVDCDWVFDRFRKVGADEKSIEACRDFLNRRVSLGWTDLDRAFESVLHKADKNTHVVYVGDGVVTAGSADPDEFVNRLQQLTNDCESTFHAVTVGSSYETVVLKSIASVGGGSLRRVNAEQGPQDIAKELLSEITQPGLTDLNVEIRGLRVARMYPEELPNIAAGKQHIIIGRYLPEGKDQSGEIVVTGKRGAETVRYKTRFVLQDAETGNSFIPRLWARAHLDQLLSQGRTAQIQDEIIALSEEYHIMTPYTSLLVLESDEDRERFKVKRRFMMRDGEKFFADGRKNANYELKQKQMKLAGLWRANLRKQILKSFVGMGRDRAMLNPWQVAQRWNRGRSQSSGFGDFGLGLDVRKETERLSKRLEESRDLAEDYAEDDVEETPSDSAPDNPDDAKLDDEMDRQSKPAETGPPSLQMEAESDQLSVSEDMGPSRNSYKGKDMGDYDRRMTESIFPAKSSLNLQQVFSFDGFGMRADEAARLGCRMPQPASSEWLVNLFPSVGIAQVIAAKPDTKWPEEAIQLSNSLLRIESLETIYGVEVTRTNTAYDPRWNRVSSVTSDLHLYSKDAWANKSTTAGAMVNVFYCDANLCGVYSQSMLLGRTRKSVPSDRATPKLPLVDYSLTPLYESFHHLNAKVEDVAENRKRLVLTHVDYEFRLLIDTERNVILETMEFRNGQQQNHVAFSDFKTVAGRPWATKITTRRSVSSVTPIPEPRAEAGQPALHLVRETTCGIKELNPGAFKKRYDSLLSEKDRVQFLQLPLPSTSDAREARTAGKAGFETHIVLADYFHHSGQWVRVQEHLEAMEKLAGSDKPGLWFVRNAMLRENEREPLRARLLERGREVAAKPTADDLGLAGYLFGQMRQVTAYNEQLELLDVLKPVYDRQPAQAGAKRAWVNARIAVYSGLGRNDLVLALRHQMATEFPWDSQAQTAYAHALTNHRQDYESAIQWLRKLLVDHAGKWTVAQEESFRNVIASFLENRGRYAELLTHMQTWVARNPKSYNVHARLLAALVWNDKLDEAEAMIQKWLEGGVAVVTDKPFDEINSFQPHAKKQLPVDVANRMNAALGMAMGQGYNLYTYRIDPKWLQPLSKVVFAFARQSNHRDYANRIIGHGHFANTDKASEIRKQAFDVLVEELATLPLPELQTFLNWSLRSTARIEREEWVNIADRLEERWAAEKIDTEKYSIGHSLLNVLSSRLAMDRRLAFMRRRIKEGGKDYRDGNIRALFELLLVQPTWKDELEAEAFSWLPQLSNQKNALGLRMGSCLPALYRLSDQMISQRYQTALKGVDQKIKANRRDYSKKKYELYRAARAGYMQRLAQQTQDAEKWLAAWMKIEHIYLSIKQGEKLKEQTQLVKDFLGDAPPAPAKPDEQIDETQQTSVPIGGQKIDDFFAGVLRHRYVMTAAHLASRRSTSKMIAKSLLKYLDAGIAMNPVPEPDGDAQQTDRKTKGAQDDVRSPDPDPKPAMIARNLSWKTAKYRLLIALDRPQELERDLESWIKRDRQTAPWRLSLARLLAEQGRLDEAVRLFKAVEHADELRPTEYFALSNWYLALDNRSEYESAKFNYYATMRESSLNQLLGRQIRRYQATDGSAPATLDTDILLMVKALLEKSAYPANYVYQVRSLYVTTKDFRLFRSVPIAALGQTAGHTYNIVSNCQYAFSAVLEEATIDELVELLRATRNGAKTVVDRRALDLLEVVAERRAVELQNQAGPHVKPALAALKRAFDHEWADGEPIMMMNFLHNLGQLPQDELASEQRRQMKQLYSWSKAGTFDRLQLANLYSNTLWSYNKHDQALLEMEAAIQEFDAANDKKWPAQANSILNGYFGKLQQKGRYVEVERILLDHLTRPRDKGQIAFFDNRLDTLYYAALANGAQVSLGQGEVLYRAYLSRLLNRLDTADDGLTMRLVNKILEILKHARGLKWAAGPSDFRAFADKRVPQLLKRATNNYRNILNAVGRQVNKFFGAEPAIRYMLDRIDQDPARFRYRNDDAWNHHASYLAGWLYHVIHVDKKKLPKDLDARLLKMALAELRRDLQSHQQRGRYFYGHNYGYFWEAKRADFIRAVETILKERKHSSDSVAYIAAYLYQISEHKRCIEVMFEAHRKGLLNDKHIHTLVGYLHGQKMYAESVPLLEGLMDRGPDNLGFRTSLMYSYFKVDRKNQMLALLKVTDEHFHKENRWNESAMSQLAGTCAKCELWEASAKYYSNAIMERRRTNPVTATGDGTLSSYYSSQAEAYIQLQQTKLAVDAAASGIVSWGNNLSSRMHSVNVLVGVFSRVNDRDDYAKFLDEEAERTQQDRPIVRKALGTAYQQKREFAKAAQQLKIATELQPNDAATHLALIDSYDALQDQPAAIKATLALLQLDRRSVESYARLGERLKADPRQQERAFTGIVEMKPNEADSHTMLATIRQRQERWDDAIHHWKHVVRIRKLEPTGLNHLIGAQIKAKQFNAARKNLKKLEETKWPRRFSNVRSWVDRHKRDLKSK